MTLYVHNVTSICPEQLVQKANHLAACMGVDKDDINTFSHTNWLDANGNRYAFINAAVKQGFVQGLQQPLQRPEWDIEERVDVEAAQALLMDSILYDPEEDDLAELMSSGKLIYMLNCDPISVQLLAGLYQAEDG